MATTEAARDDKGEALTPEDIQELVAWRTSSTFFMLPVHRRIEHEMSVIMEGIESGALIGAPGVGKTHSVRELAARVSAAEIRAANDEHREPREIYVYTAGRTTGPKTALADLYEKLLGSRPPTGPKAPTIRQLAERLALEFQDNGVQLLCIDEAQLIDPDNLDHLRQIPDHARDHGHRMGILFVGTAALRDNLARTGQLGQRVATVITLDAFSRADVAANLAGFHPQIAALRERLGKKPSAVLEDELFAKAGNNWRRFVTILANANELCLRLGRRLDAGILRMAISKLEAEA